ncbi:MAG: hypothetical protein WCO19_05080, partial [Candidatus Saccharibacteria bacterium]
LVITDHKTRQKLWEIKLSSDLKVKRSLANVNISYLNGQSIPWRSDYRYYFCFHSSWWYLLGWVIAYGSPVAKRFVDNLQKAAQS